MEKKVSVKAFNAFKNEQNARLNNIEKMLEQLLAGSNTQEKVDFKPKPQNTRSNASSKKSVDFKKEWEFITNVMNTKGGFKDTSTGSECRIVSTTGDGRGTGRIAKSARALGFKYDAVTFTLSMPMEDWKKVAANF